MPRVIIKSGDIFEAHLSNGKKGYFQYLCRDPHELESEIIRVFKEKYSLTDAVSPQHITKSEIDFHTHAFIKIGVKENAWKKIGNGEISTEIEEPNFRCSSDYGDPEIKVSKKWYVWKPSDAEPSFVGNLDEFQGTFDLGGVWPHSAIIERMDTGKFTWFYPDYHK